MRYSSSQTADASGKGILSLYAVGVSCVCGSYDSSVDNTATAQNTFSLLTSGPPDENRSSQAAAQTAGIIANMLMDPTIRQQLVAGCLGNFGQAAKARSLSMAMINKGTFSDGIPRLSDSIEIPCSRDAVKGEPVPPFSTTPPATQTGLQPTTQVVASGTSVLYPNLVRAFLLSWY